MKVYLAAIALILILCMPIAIAISKEEVLPTDDSYVMADLSGKPAGRPLSKMNFGKSADLIVGYYFNETGEGEFVISIAFLKFDLSGYGKLRNVTLTLTVTDVDSSVPPILQVYYVEDDSWSEGNITFSNAPPPSQLLGEARIMGAGHVNLNLTDLVSKDKVITLAFACKKVSSQSSILVISSKEAKTGRPMITFENQQPFQPYMATAIVIALAVITALYVNLFRRKRREK